MSTAVTTRTLAGDLGERESKIDLEVLQGHDPRLDHAHDPERGQERKHDRKQRVSTIASETRWVPTRKDVSSLHLEHRQCLP